MKKKIYAFDFDGTITTRDTLIAFIRYAKGTSAFVLGFLLHAPLLVLMKLGLYPNWKAKQRVFAYFFKGLDLEAFNDLRAEGADVVIVSASIDNWVQPFFTAPGALDLPALTVLGTQIEVAEGRLTGRFLTRNCYGQEKVNRLLALYPHRSDYHLTAFGDSRGDRELLAFADESHFKPFRP